MTTTWESDFSHACSFCRMLMNWKNFRFTPILHKTSDVIFLKSPKTLFLDHFWPYLVLGTPLYLKFQKKLMRQFRENLQTDARTDGRSDGQTLFHRTLLVTARGPKRCEICTKLKIKTPERRHWLRYVVFIVNSDHIKQLFQVFLLLTLNKQMLAGKYSREKAPQPILCHLFLSIRPGNMKKSLVLLYFRGL